MTIVSVFMIAVAVSKTSSSSSRPTRGAEEKVTGGRLAGGDFHRKYNPNPLAFSHGKHLPPEEGQRHSSCLTASEIKFRLAVWLPFSKGDEHWGINRR